MSAFFKMLYQKCQHSHRNGVFLSSKVSGKGSFYKVENADMCPTLLVECGYRAWDKCFLCVWSASIDAFFYTCSLTLFLTCSGVCASFCVRYHVITKPYSGVGTALVMADQIEDDPRRFCISVSSLTSFT